MRIKLVVATVLLTFAAGCRGGDWKPTEKSAAPKSPTSTQGPEGPAVEKAEKEPAPKPPEPTPQVDAPADKPTAKPADAPPGEEKPDGPVNEPNPTGRKALVELYIQSRCVFGLQVMDNIHPLLKRVGEWVDFKVHFIGQEVNGKLVSSRGDEEVKGDMIQLCLQHHEGDGYRFMDVIYCMNRDLQALPDNWEECATTAELDEETRGKLMACHEGEEGRNLLRDSFAAARKRKARVSPTLFVGGNAYDGGRTELNLLRAICGEFAGGLVPTACADVPPPVAIVAIVLNDRRCKDRTCQTPALEMSFKNKMPGIQFRQLDYSDEEGRKLYDEEGLKLLPVLLFDAEIEKADSYPRFKRLLKTSGSGRWKVFHGRARFDPAKEVCDNGEDDTANGLVDCLDPTCRDTLACRNPAPGRLELYVVSLEPFGITALNAVRQVLDAFGEEIRFELHFIGEEKDGRLTSRYGEGEEQENMRALCAVAKAPLGQAMGYVWCRNKTLSEEGGAARSAARMEEGAERAAAKNAAAKGVEENWKACAQESGIGVETITACVDKEARGLLAADYKIAAGLGIKASPTWVINGQVKFSGIKAEDVQDRICEHNPGLAGCNRKLETETP